MMWLDKLNQSQTLCLHGIYNPLLGGHPMTEKKEDLEEEEEDCHHHSVEGREELLPCL